MEEAGRLIAEAEKSRKSPHLADFIRLALNTGCRRGELLKLQWERVDLKANLSVSRFGHAEREEGIVMNR